MYCPHCGKQIDDRDTFCRYCGRSIEEIVASAAPARSEPAPSGKYSDLDKQFPAKDPSVGRPFSSAGKTAQMNTTEKESRPILAIVVLITAIVILVIFGVFILVNQDGFFADKVKLQQTATRQPTSKPTPKPTAKRTATPKPTPYYESHPYGFYSLSGAFYYEDFVLDYNYNIEWRINQGSGKYYDLTIKYQPEEKSTVAYSDTIRHQLTDDSAINITYHVNEGFIEEIIYLADFEANEDNLVKYISPVYSILNVLSHEDFLDYDETLEKIDILRLMSNNAEKQIDADKVHIEIRYYKSSGLRMVISLKKE